MLCLSGFELFSHWVHLFVPLHSSGSRYKYHHLVNSNVNSKMTVREHMMSF